MNESKDKRFVVVSGLPGSGKSSLAWRLSPLLNLPVIDKDDILERLFHTKGTGDAAHRRMLSRESDQIFRNEARIADGAILVSFWHLLGMASDSGTPMAWLGSLSDDIVHVHCVCQPEIASTRFLQRKRHVGHLDNQRSEEQTLTSIRALAQLPPPAIGRRIEVDTTNELDLEAVAREVLTAFRDRANG